MSTDEKLDLLLRQVGRLEEQFAAFMRANTVRDFYTTAEAAALIGKAEFTVREYIRLGRLRGEKRKSGRGKYREWVVSRAELERYQREGLLPAANGHFNRTPLG